MIKKLLLFFFIFSLCNGAFAGGPLVKGGRKVMQSFTLGNTHVKFPPEIMRPYYFNLESRFFDAKINGVRYPKLSASNDGKILSAAIQFKADLAFFEAHAHQIVQNIKSNVFVGPVDYQNYLPRDIDYLYIGEIHNEGFIQDEISQFIAQLPSIYPNRTIYLATEFIPAKEVPFSRQTQLAYSDKALDSWFEGNEDHASSIVFQSARKGGLQIVGLEPQLALLEQGLVDGTYIAEEDFEDYATSMEGIYFRNNYWARIVREIRRRDPEALIVVYGGIDHVAYHNPFCMPSLIGGKGFVMQVLTPRYLPEANPLFCHFRESDAIRDMFLSSEEAKLVNSWENPQSYNHLLGVDLSIIVHE